MRELDPSWRPKPSAYTTVEGLIRTYEGEARQAEGRFAELTRAGIGPDPFATSSCISIACYPEQDGPTTVTLGPLWEVEHEEQPAFSGYLETPNRAVVVSTVDQQTVVEAKVPKTRTHVRIWLNHPRWPDQVTIGLE